MAPRWFVKVATNISRNFSTIILVNHIQINSFKYIWSFSHVHWLRLRWLSWVARANCPRLVQSPHFSRRSEPQQSRWEWISVCAKCDRNFMSVPIVRPLNWSSITRNRDHCRTFIRTPLPPTTLQWFASAHRRISWSGWPLWVLAWMLAYGEKSITGSCSNTYGKPFCEEGVGDLVMRFRVG